MSTRIRAVIFDLDDTLFDRRNMQGEVLRIIAEEFPSLFAGRTADELQAAFAVSDVVGTEQFNQGASWQAVRVGRAEVFLEALGLDRGPAREIADAYVRAHSRAGGPGNSWPRWFPASGWAW